VLTLFLIHSLLTLGAAYCATSDELSLKGFFTYNSSDDQSGEGEEEEERTPKEAEDMADLDQQDSKPAKKSTRLTDSEIRATWFWKGWLYCQLCGAWRTYPKSMAKKLNPKCTKAHTHTHTHTHTHPYSIIFLPLSRFESVLICTANLC
jgi:hypothetical protein